MMKMKYVSISIAGAMLTVGLSCDSAPGSSNSLPEIIDIQAQSPPPYFSPAESSEWYSFTASVTDPDGDPMTYE